MSANRPDDSHIMPSCFRLRGARDDGPHGSQTGLPVSMSMITACHAREPGLNAPLTHIPVRHTDRKVEVAARMVVRPGYEKGLAACVVWRPEADGRGLGSPLPNGRPTGVRKGPRTVARPFSYPRGESNAYRRNRNPKFYPLNYRGEANRSDTNPQKRSPPGL